MSLARPDATTPAPQGNPELSASPIPNQFTRRQFLAGSGKAAASLLLASALRQLNPSGVEASFSQAVPSVHTPASGSSPTETLFVKFRQGVSLHERFRAFRSLGMEPTRKEPLFDYNVARAYRDVAPHEAAQWLEKKGLALRAGAEQVGHLIDQKTISTNPNSPDTSDVTISQDPLVYMQQSPYPGLWQVERFNPVFEDGTWLQNLPPSNVDAVILDTGTAQSPHQDQIRDGVSLVDRTICKNWSDPDNPSHNIETSNPHGRTLEGTLAVSGNDKFIVGGDMNRVRKINVKKVSRESDGNVYEQALAEALNEASQESPHGVVCFAITGFSLESSPLLKDAMITARKDPNRDMLIVAAVGFDGDPYSLPWAMRGIVRAGVFNEKRTTKVDWSHDAANMNFPGISIVTFDLNNHWIANATGQSMASGVGLSLLVWARSFYPQYNEKQIRQLGKQAQDILPDGSPAANMLNFYTNYQRGIRPTALVED